MCLYALRTGGGAGGGDKMPVHELPVLDQARTVSGTLVRKNFFSTTGKASYLAISLHL